MLHINDTNRLTKAELDDYEINSGITELQYHIIRLRYYDCEQPTVQAICTELHISESKYHRELRKALSQIYKYDHS